jgi:hypothetical protein
LEISPSKGFTFEGNQIGFRVPAENNTGIYSNVRMEDDAKSMNEIVQEEEHKPE